jgi:hypothetical protein
VFIVPSLDTPVNSTDSLSNYSTIKENENIRNFKDLTKPKITYGRSNDNKLTSIEIQDATKIYYSETEELTVYVVLSNLDFITKRVVYTGDNKSNTYKQIILKGVQNESYIHNQQLKQILPLLQKLNIPLTTTKANIISMNRAKEFSTEEQTFLNNTGIQNVSDIDLVLKNKDEVLKNINLLNTIFDDAIKICEARKNEGNYINSSVKHLRKSLIDIIHYKNSGSTILLPDTINGCYYCDEESNSCLTKQRTINENPVSLIEENEFFKWMFHCLKNDNYEQAGFCNDLIICIFCTFNNSRTADPPKLPYVNINKYKKNFYKFLNKYGECLTSDYDKVFRDKQYQTADFLNNIQNCFSRVNFLIKTLFSEQLKQTFTIAEFSLNDDLFTISQNFQQYIKTIDTWNEATSIGTLEFMDIFCKFNSTQYLCDKVTSSDVIYEPLYKPFTTIRDAKNLFK